MKALVDTNVLLDVLLKREPFYKDSALVWTLSQEGQIEGFLSAISINNLYYIVRKLLGRDQAGKFVDRILEDFQIVDLIKGLLVQARSIPNKDFEDLIQYFSALHEGCDVLVTRNKRDFPRVGIRLMNPAEFLKSLEH